MRLTQRQIEIILATVRSATESTARTVLFGSRLDDGLRGGDVDLLIESELDISLMQRASIKLELEAILGLPVDILALKRGEQPSAFQRIALAKGVAL